VLSRRRSSCRSAADRETSSDFQLIGGTNRDLHSHVRQGQFREDLLARINLWTFRFPGLRERLEDIEPNIQFELDQFARATGMRVSFNKEARERFLAFAVSPHAFMGGELPRPERRAGPHGHAGAGRPHLRRSRG